ncbi:MAG: nitric oxide reductase activation protein [Lachnospiraceae bacterium]
MWEKQAEDHRLEIENRIRNLFWTISGDYTLDVKPDAKAFLRSRSAALYDAMKQGAFARYFDSGELALYMMKKMYLSAQEKPLLELVQLCVDAAAYPKMAEERPGTDDIRKEAFADLLRQEEAVLNRTFFGQVKVLMMKEYLGREFSGIPETVRQTAEKIRTLEQAGDTLDIIHVIENIYNTIFDQSFEKQHGNLDAVLNVPPKALSDAAWQDCLTDEQMEEIIKKYLAGLGKDMMSLQIREKAKKQQRNWRESGEREEEDEEITDEASLRKVQEYVALNYGKNGLSPLEQEKRRNRLCTGIHADCFLHDTDGILQNPVKANNQYRFNQLQFEKNRLYYYKNSRIIKRNIKTLADTLKKALVMRSQEDFCRSTSGQLAPARLWKLGRTEDEKLFDKRIVSGSAEFVVELLLDSSGSQAVRQSQVAVQGYIISEALSAVGIPHRVVSYCTFWNHTVLHRFRDYDDRREKNERIFEFRASGDNRDGLAVRAAYDSMLERPELHKILILLSDGKPCDVSIRRPGIKSPADYTGETAVKDTAFEVRRARALGISVLGIFAGNYEDTATEKMIFGKDFAYIRDISNFSHIVGAYLRRQLEEE